MATRQSMIERTNEQILLAHVNQKYKPAVGTYDAMPEGIHVMTVALRTALKPGDAQMNALVTAINAIAGVSNAKVMCLGPDSGVPTLPVTHQCNLVVEQRFEIVPVPE